MPSVSVLYIEDNVVGPHLQLLRNVCEPTSKSRPHVTVRYFDKLSVPKDHLATKVEHIDLLEVGSFGLDDDSAQENKTVFIRCQSDDLLPLEHKPFFPTSQFHITIYDGTSEPFARSLIRLLKKYTWGFRVPLPANTSLTQIEIKPKNRKRPPPVAEQDYSPAARDLFRLISGKVLTYDLVSSLSDRQRLLYAKAICTRLASTAADLEKTARLSTPKSLLLESADSDKEYEMHLTPPELAREIATYAASLLTNEQRENIDFGDPAVGTGAFFAALLSTRDRLNIRSAIGVDISPRHVAAARWRWESKAMEVIEGDYLHMEELSPRNLILANPPYMRHQGIPAKYKQELRQRASADIGMRISGLSGQYLYFLLLSHKWMASGAVAAWLVPSEFMQTTYGRALRYYLTKTVQLVRIHQFSADVRQFENAETLPCVVAFRNIPPAAGGKVEFTCGGTLERPAIRNELLIEALDPEAKWSIEPRPKKRRDDSFLRLGDLFSVRRGIATGDNDFFVLERKEAKRLGIPTVALKPLLPKAKSLVSDVIESEADGFPSVDKKLCVIDSMMSQSEIAQQYPSLMTYLQTGIDKGVLKRHLVGRRKPWYKQEQRDPAPFLCTYMGKAHGDKPAIRFILNKSRAIATNTYLMLYPNLGLQRILESRPDLVDVLFQLLKDASWEAMAEFSRSHAGGLSKIEPRELLEVWIGPVPPLLREVARRQLFEEPI